MVAVNCELFTKVVARALPFQFTTDPDTKPVPFTVSVNPAPPGATASGTRGLVNQRDGVVSDCRGDHSSDRFTQPNQSQEEAD